MHRYYTNRLGLCEEAGETSPAPSGAPVAPETPPTADPANPPTAPPAAPAPEASVKVGRLERVKALMQGAGASAQTIANLQAQLATATTERDGLRASLDAALADKQTLQAQVTQLKAEQQSVEDALAGIGIPQTQLPAQAPAGKPASETIEELQTKLQSTTDPKASGEIVQQIKKLRAHAHASKN